MSLLTWILLFSLLGGLLSVLAAATFLSLPNRHHEALLPHFVSFAIGALLGAAFLALIPHAMSASPNIDFHEIGLAVLLGILVFFLLEKMVIWRHCHAHDCEVHTPDESHGEKAAGTLVLVGDGIHNLVDGVLIAAAFMTDIHLGVVTSIAVATHEIPQEVGDFAILLQSGMSRRKALLFNAISSLSTIVGALIAYYSLASAQALLPYVLAIAASSFIYIAVADLIPSLHKRPQMAVTVQQTILILLGVLVIYLAHSTLH